MDASSGHSRASAIWSVDWSHLGSVEATQKDGEMDRTKARGREHHSAVWKAHRSAIPRVEKKDLSMAQGSVDLSSAALLQGLVSVFQGGSR